MNTLRFFLLLVSIFFFAFLFQTNAIHGIRQREEVLSGRTTSRIIVSTTPAYDSTQKIFSQYRYPNSELQFKKRASETLTSGDGLEKIVRWYVVRLHTAYPQDEKFESKKDKTFFLTGTDKKNKITVQIKQSGNSPLVLITISLTAS